MDSSLHTASLMLLLAATAAGAAEQPAPAGPSLPKLTVVDVADADYVAPNATTATRTDTPVMETPISIQVITQQVLKDQQVIRIDQALKNVSGVTVGAGGDTSFGDAFDAVSIRGFQTDAHLRNGVRIDSAGSDTELYTQQLANVESIEVLKGPAAILYGAVEPGGIINIVTKQPQATPAYELTQQVGSYDQYRASLDATGPLNASNSLLYRVNASYNTSHSIVDLGFTRDLFLAPTLKLLIGSTAEVTMEYEHKDANFNGNYSIFPLVQAPSGSFVALYDDPHLNFGERSAAQELTDLLAVKWSWRLNDQWSVSQQLLENWVRTAAPQVTLSGIGPLDPANPASAPAVYRFESPYNTRDTTAATYLDVTGHFATGPIRHTLLVGGDAYRFNSKFTLTNSNLTYAPNAAVDSLISLYDPVHPGTPFGPAQPEVAGEGPTDSWGLHIQDQLTLPGNVYLLAGARYQHVHEANYSGVTLDSLTSTPLSGSAVTPRVGAVWRPAAWLSLYGNYAKNWGPSNGYPLTGGGLVPPTSARQKEIGVKVDLLDARLSGTFALYDLTKTNIPTPDPANPCCFLVTGAVRSRGLEVDLTGEIARGWNLIANYSNTDARIVATNDPSNPVGTQWYETPRVTANLWSTYDHSPGATTGLKIGAGVTYQGVQPAANYTGTPAPQTSDYAMLPDRAVAALMGAYRFAVGTARLTAQLNVANLFDKRYFSYLSLANPGGTGTYTYNGLVYGADRRLYGDPRTIVGSLSARF